MSGVLDLFNLIFLLLAVVIFLKLRSVLGRRTGHEQPRRDPYAPRSESKTIPFPGNKAGKSPAASGATRQAAASSPEESPVEEAPVVGAVDAVEASAGGGVAAEGLAQIAAADRGFDRETFLAGARLAHETIVTAFAHGESATLQPLLGTAVWEQFQAALARRAERGHQGSLKFVGFDSARITDATLAAGRAAITVRFVSQQVSCVLDGEGRVVEGDPNVVSRVGDSWTFERAVASPDPNWRLVATHSDAHNDTPEG